MARLGGEEDLTGGEIKVLVEASGRAARATAASAIAIALQGNGVMMMMIVRCGRIVAAR